MASIFQCAPDLCAHSAKTGPSNPGRLVDVLWQTAFVLATAFAPLTAEAVTPESPEVRELIKKGLGYLDDKTHRQLGGKCLIALAFLKDGASHEHPRIREALEACEKATSEDIKNEKVYNNYSICLGIIFLAEFDGKKHRGLIESFRQELFGRQKDHGGWGYAIAQEGDTSQTQYAALSCWELLQIGISPEVDDVERCVNWLLRTQDPSGAWGYQGKDPGEGGPIKQRKTSLSMLAAGMGSTMILGNSLGLTGPGANAKNSVSQGEKAQPSALKRADLQATKRVPTLSGTGVDRQRLLEAISRGQDWFDKNFSQKSILSWEYSSYLLYSIERYKSFEEQLTGITEEEPDWYQEGYKYLNKQQKEDGSWDSMSGKPCSTAFAVLFLMRSTQKSIKASLGEGTLIGGRGLQADLSRMKLQRGRLVAEKKTTEINALLSMLENSDDDRFESLLSNPASLQVGEAGPEEARRLQQIVKSGVPEARLLSVSVLTQMRDLDQVPTLLYAMTDPDKRVVREARDGLRFISRRFGGFGLPDNFNETQRYDALDRWKEWYHRIRPDAPLLP